MLFVPFLHLFQLCVVSALKFSVNPSPYCTNFTFTNIYQDFPNLKCLHGPSSLLYHQLLTVKKHDIGLWNIENYLFPIKSWALTQKRGKLIVWTTNEMVLQLFKENDWMKSHSDSIKVKFFDFESEIAESLINNTQFHKNYNQALKTKLE